MLVWTIRYSTLQTAAALGAAVSGPRPAIGAAAPTVFGSHRAAVALVSGASICTATRCSAGNNHSGEHTVTGSALNQLRWRHLSVSQNDHQRYTTSLLHRRGFSTGRPGRSDRTRYGGDDDDAASSDAVGESSAEEQSRRQRLLSTKPDPQLVAYIENQSEFHRGLLGSMLPMLTASLAWRVVPV